MSYRNLLGAVLLCLGLLAFARPSMADTVDGITFTLVQANLTGHPGDTLTWEYNIINASGSDILGDHVDASVWSGGVGDAGVFDYFAASDFVIPSPGSLMGGTLYAFYSSPTRENVIQLRPVRSICGPTGWHGGRPVRRLHRNHCPCWQRSRTRFDEPSLERPLGQLSRSAQVRSLIRTWTSPHEERPGLNVFAENYFHVLMRAATYLPFSANSAARSYRFAKSAACASCCSASAVFLASSKWLAASAGFPPCSRARPH